MKEMILCMLVLAAIIGAANFFELPARRSSEASWSAAGHSQVEADAAVSGMGAHPARAAR